MQPSCHMIGVVSTWVKCVDCAKGEEKGKKNPLPPQRQLKKLNETLQSNVTSGYDGAIMSIENLGKKIRRVHSIRELISLLKRSILSKKKSEDSRYFTYTVVTVCERNENSLSDSTNFVLRCHVWHNLFHLPPLTGM